MEPVLVVKDLDKSFVGVHAVDHVSFECYPGTVHVLQGENGAGKSTILKMLSGMYHPDSGEILIGGKPVVLRHPNDARKQGISMVYQELSILPDLTVAQNIFLNKEDKVGKGLLIREATLMKESVKLAQKYGIEIDPYARTGDLPIASRQMVEILKALSDDPDILILDEPTSTLTCTEVDKLYSIVQEITSLGKTVLFISHRMEEIFRFGTSATILKDGKLVATVNLSEVTEAQIIQMMVGRELKEIFPPKLAEKACEPVLKVENLSDGRRFFDINLELRKGEILGIGALDGQGQTHMLRAIAGIQHHTAGSVFLNGKRLNYQQVRKAMRYGIGYVPEDRKVQALCLGMSVGENLSLASMPRRQKLGFIQRNMEKQDAQGMVDQMNIRTPSLMQQVFNLSGGNQQKVSIGKSLEDRPKVLLLNEPTRGIDVQAKQEIYRLVRKLAQEGVAILCYTSDMMETIGLCDRVITMFEGRITSELAGAEITEENIMRGAMNLKDATGTEG